MPDPPAVAEIAVPVIAALNTMLFEPVVNSVTAPAEFIAPATARVPVEVTLRLPIEAPDWFRLNAPVLESVALPAVPIVNVGVIELTLIFPDTEFKLSAVAVTDPAPLTPPEPDADRVTVVPLNADGIFMEPLFVFVDTLIVPDEVKPDPSVISKVFEIWIELAVPP